MGKIILDLLCGCGGFSLGFKDSGNKIIGVELKEIQCKTWEYNIEGEIIQADILKLDLNILPKKIDILICSPECQSFSRSNKYRDFETNLIKKCLEIKEYFQPKYWIMEEVEDVAYVTNKGRLIKKRNQLDENEFYLIDEKYIDFIKASDHGFPHRRKRLFAGYYPRLKPTNTTEIKVKTPIAKSRGYYHGKEDHVKVLKNLRKLLINSGRSDLTTYEIYQNPIHPEVWKWLMGFPREFKVFGNKKQQFEQIGNAVIPKISSLLYQQINENKPVKLMKQTTLMNWN